MDEIAFVQDTKTVGTTNETETETETETEKGIGTIHMSKDLSGPNRMTDPALKSRHAPLQNGGPRRSQEKRETKEMTNVSPLHFPDPDIKFDLSCSFCPARVPPPRVPAVDRPLQRVPSPSADTEPEEGEEMDAVDEQDEAMASMMGFGGFGTTKVCVVRNFIAQLLPTLSHPCRASQS